MVVDRRLFVGGLAGLAAGRLAAGPTAERWQAGPVVTIGSAYAELELSEFSIAQGPVGRGGALALDGARLIVASADGRFFGLDPATGVVTRERLPRLDLGRDRIGKSTFIRLQEVAPRVHDLLLVGDAAYVSYDRYDPAEDRIRFHIDRWTRRQRRWSAVYRTPVLDAPLYAMGNGGKLALEPGGRRLFFSLGDYSLDRRRQLPSDIAAQKPELPWGKIHRLDLPDGRSQMVSLGHRNPQGLVFLGDGRLLASEHGPQGGDELNLIRPGLNYGWPWRSHGTEYGSYAEYWQQLGQVPAGPFEEPMHAFVPSIAPTQLLQVRDGFHPKWDGDLLLASLKARSLYRIRLERDRVIHVEPIAIGHRLRDIKQIDSGFVMLADDGRLLAVRLAPPRPAPPR